MAPISWREPSAPADGSLSEAERHVLLETARASIRWGLEHGAPLEPSLEGYPDRLQVRRGCFVTLYLAEQLRGCVGCLRARVPLVREVARAAYSAAFRDPRFGAVRAHELERLRLHVSVLSEPAAVEFSDEGDLIAQLRPGTDGLILSEGCKLGTFLPEVWEKFPEPSEFLRQLRVKAGLPPDYWSESLRVERYTTDAFG